MGGEAQRGAEDEQGWGSGKQAVLGRADPSAEDNRLTRHHTGCGQKLRKPARPQGTLWSLA